MTKLTGKNQNPGVGNQSATRRKRKAEVALWEAELITNLLQKEKSINAVATVTFG